jgi:hypothetical protein
MALFQNTIVRITIAGMLLAGFVWYSFLREDAQPLLNTQDLTQASVDSDVVGGLLQLRAVSLSGTIFTDPAFQSLQDFGSEIIPEPVGRPNPFAPLSSAPVATTSQAQAAQAR